MRTKYELPKKWCIKWASREIKEACEKYFNKHWTYYQGSWCTSRKTNPYWSYTNKSFPTEHGYKEITFDQFKRYILKEEPEDFSYLNKLLKKLEVK